MSRKDTERWLNNAAVYVRMSTEHQQYSTSNQMDVIRENAKKRGLGIVKEYSDEGKSGLNIQGRDSLSQMIRDVDEGRAQYSSILVYDVSRWGRFQDADESAYYEYICRRAGVSVHYCAEQFENDGSPMSTVMKSMKRTMAGEYSRELSTKVFQGACSLQFVVRQSIYRWVFQNNNRLPCSKSSAGSVRRLLNQRRNAQP
jgi:DNA invertase Pin-like site-specific DNA recombinase